MEVCLVTGGAGFIGSHLVKALLARKYVVRVLDNRSTGSLSNLGRAAGGAEVVVGDVEDLDLVREMVEGVDVLFHLASAPPDDFPPAGSESCYQCDLGTANVLIVSRECRVRRLVYASTTQVYGRVSGVPCSETDAVAPATPFAAAKLSGEQDCAAFTRLYGLETVRLRYSNIFGPRQSPASPHARIVLDTLMAVLAGHEPPLEGTGLEFQDLLYVEDAVEATLHAALTPGVGGRVYNVGQGAATRATDILAVLNELVGANLTGHPTGSALEEELQTLVDVTRARMELGFSSVVDLRTGLSRCLRAVSGCLFPTPRMAQPRLTNA